jgi:hypothetical protein
MKPTIPLLVALMLAGCVGKYSSWDYDPKVVVERNLKQTQPSNSQATRTVAAPAESTTPTERSIERRTRDGELWQPVGGKKAWVLSIGIGQYRNSNVPSLPFAKVDASRMRDWFLQPDIKAMNRENVHVLFDEQATRENLLAQIDWLRKQAMPEDAVVIYFAGHGAPELAADGKSVDAKYLLLYDTDPGQLFATGFSLDDLTRKLEAVKAKVQVVILEACYPRIIQEMGAQGGRVILTASSGRQVAIGSDEIKGGLFTHYLLAAWGNGNRRLLSDSFEDAKEQVRRAANRLGSTQEPTKFGDQNVDVILSR